MSRLMSKRFKAIMDMVYNYGYIGTDYYLISFWDLASNLNNCWHSPLFVNEKYKDNQYRYRKDWAIPYYMVGEAYHMLDKTVSKMGGKIINQNKFNDYNHATYYIFKK